MYGWRVEVGAWGGEQARAQEGRVIGRPKRRRQEGTGPGREGARGHSAMGVRLTSPAGALDIFARVFENPFQQCERGNVTFVSAEPGRRHAMNQNLKCPCTLED